MLKDFTLSLELEPTENRVVQTAAIFWSHDVNTAKIYIELLRKGTPIILNKNVTVRVMMLFDDENKSEHIYTAKIEDKLKGLVSITLEESMRAYVGQVTCGVYVDYQNEEKTDNGYFTFGMRRSLIDKDMPELQKLYVSDFEKALEKFKEIEKKIEQNDVVTHPELKKYTYDKATIDGKVKVLEDNKVNKSVYEREMKEKANRKELELLEAEKANQDYVDEQLSKKATKSELENHIFRLDVKKVDEQTFLDTVNKLSAGEYKGDGVVNYYNISNTYNAIRESNTIKDKWIQRYDPTTGEITLTDTSLYSVVKVDVPNNGTIDIKKNNLETGSCLLLLDAKEKAFKNYNYDYKDLMSESFVTDKGNMFTIDVNNLRRHFFEVSKLMFEFKNDELKTSYIRYNNAFNFTEKKWYDDSNVEHLDLTKMKTTKFFPDKSIPRYDKNTGQPDMVDVSNRFVYFFKVPTKGRIRMSKYTLPDQQFMLITDKDNKVFANYDHNHNKGNTKVDFLEITDKEIIIDLAKLKVTHTKTYGFYLVVWKQVKDFYIKLEEGYNVSDVFEWSAPAKLVPSLAKNIVMMSKLPIVVGENSYVYLDNVLQYGNAYAEPSFFVHNQPLIANGFRYTGTGDKDYYFLRLYDDGDLELEHRFEYIPISKNAGSGQTKKVLMIGESTTDNLSFMTQFRDKFKDDPLNVEFVGTRQHGGIKHEGRSGWTMYDLVNVQEKLDRFNSFWNPNTKKFDFDYYLKQNNIAEPDIVFINFGLNDAIQFRNVQNTMNDYDYLIKNIKKRVPDVKIAIGLTSLPSRWENMTYHYRNAIPDGVLEIIKNVISTYEGRERENIYLAPIHTAVDPYWDMQYEEVKLSHLNDKMITVGKDGAHPSAIGYGKQADVCYNVVKYIVS